MSQKLHRRDFLNRVGAAAAASAMWHPAIGRAGMSANEKLNIGLVGTSGRASDNAGGVSGENIVAVCDIDDRLLDSAVQRFPGAKKYADFRKMLELRDIDAVVVSTADHTHAPASAAALRLKKHVYCEKPLTHTVYEARTIAKLAKDAKVATQMGTQIHAEDNYRRVVELIQGGAIGTVREAHVWCGKAWAGGERPTDSPPVPPYLHWDLWLGPVAARPYNPTYQPANWRRWWDFGNGTLGDMACHFMDLPFWALDLRHPTSVAAEGPPVHPETTPDALSVRYEFPARKGRAPVVLTWTDGNKKPPILAEKGLSDWGGGGVFFVGDKGQLVADYSRRVLMPEADFRDYKAPEPSIATSIGHHAEWIAACKDGRPTSCNFDYGGALTETVLLGNVAYRTGKKLTWDAEAMKAIGCPEADAFLHREYRKGWTL